MDADVQLIAITFDNGTVGIMHFVLEPRLPEGANLEGHDVATGRRAATDAAIEEEIAASAYLAKPVAWRRITRDDVPTDRTFRDAWHDLEGRVRIHMGRAREIHRGRLREIRAGKLAQLDVEYQRADETGDVARKSAIAARKQKLRDITKHPSIEAASTPEELTVAALQELES